MADEFHVVQGVFDRHRYGGEDFTADHDGAPLFFLRLLRYRGYDGNRTGAHPLHHLGARWSDVDHAEPCGGGFTQRGRAVLAPMHFLAVLRAPQALDELVEGEVEGDVFVGTIRFRAHQGAGAYQGEFHPIARRGAELLVMTAHLDLERESFLREVRHLFGLLGDVIFKPIRDSGAQSVDGSFHGVLFSGARRLRNRR